MDFSNVIINALGLQDVQIEKIEQNKNDLSLKIVARQDKSACRCYHCQGPILYVHEWKERTIKGPPFGAFLYVTILLYQLRGSCHICDDRVRSAKLTFVHPQFENMTLALCELAGRLMEEMPCGAVARWLGLNSKTMWDLDQYRMKSMKPLMKLPEKIDLSKMSADEVHFRTMPKVDSITKPEIKFVTNLVCYKEGKVLSNAPGRDAKALATCLKILSPEQRASIKTFAVDMHEPFMAAIRKLCPNAQICVDRFHLAERVNDAFDELRKAEFKKAKDSNDTFQLGMLSPQRRFVLVEREKKLKKGDLKMLDRLKELNRNILNGMILVEHFHRMLDKTDVIEFRKSLLLWYGLVREAGITAFKNLASLIRKYRNYIEAYINSKLTTAKSEGLNNKIKVLRRSGYGYTNQTSYLNKILQRCGYLNSRFIKTSDWFWRLPADLAQNTPF
ncbi:MAG: ISL3 family transposase [Bdellovibrionaceae bacterium]|nr:ISL3 family transposase [Pseudobdellovibrionaceae bacterium]